MKVPNLAKTVVHNHIHGPLQLVLTLLTLLLLVLAVEAITAGLFVEAAVAD